MILHHNEKNGQTEDNDNGKDDNDIPIGCFTSAFLILQMGIGVEFLNRPETLSSAGQKPCFESGKLHPDILPAPGPVKGVLGQHGVDITGKFRIKIRIDTQKRRGQLLNVGPLKLFNGAKETWSEEIVLRDDAPMGDLGYPASVLVGDDLLTVYYQRPHAEANCGLYATRWNYREFLK